MTNPTYNPDSHVPVAIADLELLHERGHLSLAALWWLVPLRSLKNRPLILEAADIESIKGLVLDFDMRNRGKL